MNTRLAGGLVALGLAIVGVGIWVFLHGEESSSSSDSVFACNGSAALCGRPLNDVVFPATHNSFAAADARDFRFPQQDTGIRTQLDDGIRGLWIDSYYGFPGRRVYTDTSRINPKLNAQLEDDLGPKFEAAADRLRRRISRPQGEKPRIYLCHGFCELGALDAESALHEIKRFLDEHTHEVLIIDIEDYVAPEDMVAVIEKSGLADYAYRGPAGPPWPTLRELIDSGQRVLITAEHMSGGASWYLPTDGLFQETPFGAKRPSQLSCEPNRGSPDNSLFLLNHWINTDPKPLPKIASLVNRNSFLLERAQRCESERGLLPNVLAVDFYREGDLLSVARTLNGSDG
jgi:hypothetical protein